MQHDPDTSSASPTPALDPETRAVMDLLDRAGRDDRAQLPAPRLEAMADATWEARAPDLRSHPARARTAHESRWRHAAPRPALRWAAALGLVACLSAALLARRGSPPHPADSVARAPALDALQEQDLALLDALWSDADAGLSWASVDDAAKRADDWDLSDVLGDADALGEEAL